MDSQGCGIALILGSMMASMLSMIMAALKMIGIIALPWSTVLLPVGIVITAGLTLGLAVVGAVLVGMIVGIVKR